MTTIAQAREAVNQRLNAEWANETPFYLDNEGVPDVPTLDDPGPEWIRAAVRNLPGAQETFGRSGNRQFTRPANIAFQIFTAAGTGTARADDLAQRIKEIFEAVRIGPDLVTNAMTVAEVGPSGPFFQVNCTVALVAYETR